MTNAFHARLAKLGYSFPMGIAAGGVDSPAAQIDSANGHHRILVTGGDGGAPRDDSWALTLRLNGAVFNRWSAANFATVEDATAHALRLIDAIVSVEATPAAPAVAEEEGGAFYVMLYLGGGSTSVDGPFASYDVAEAIRDRMLDLGTHGMGTLGIVERPASIAQFAAPIDVADDAAAALEELARAVEGHFSESPWPAAMMTAWDAANVVLSRMGINVEE